MINSVWCERGDAVRGFHNPLSERPTLFFYMLRSQFVGHAPVTRAIRLIKIRGGIIRTPLALGALRAGAATDLPQSVHKDTKEVTGGLMHP